MVKGSIEAGLLVAMAAGCVCNGSSQEPPDAGADPVLDGGTDLPYHSSASSQVRFGFVDAQPVVADFDGDGVADVAVFRPGDGTWTIKSRSFGQVVARWGTAGDIAVPAKILQTKAHDMLLYRPATGGWFALRCDPVALQDPKLFDGAGPPGLTHPSFGLPTDIPVPADYDGDGLAELAVWRPGNHTFYLRKVDASLATVSSEILPHGELGDIPVPADFDGDRRTDLAVWRPSTQEFHVSLRAGGFLVRKLGEAGDTPLAGDFDGDGKADPAVFRSNAGEWRWLTSSGEQHFSWGQQGDVPRLADLDGDGRVDLVAYRPTTLTWHTAFSGTRDPGIASGIWSVASTGGHEVRGFAEYQGSTYAGLSWIRFEAGDPDGWSRVLLRTTAGWIPVYTLPKQNQRIYSLEVYANKLYLGARDDWCGTGPGDLHVFDGSSWSIVPVHSGSDPEPYAIRHLAVFEGKLYAGAYAGPPGSPSGARVYVYDGTSWSVSATALQDGTVQEGEVLLLLEHGGKLYAGTGTANVCTGLPNPFRPAGALYRLDGTSWTFVREFQQTSGVFAMATANGRLYVGLGGTAAYSLVGRVLSFDGSTWREELAGDLRPPGIPVQKAIYGMGVHRGQVYAGSYEDALGAVVYASDGDSWRVTYDAPGTRCYNFFSSSTGTLHAGGGTTGQIYSLDLK